MLKNSLKFFYNKKIILLGILASIVSLFELISVAAIFPYLEIITDQPNSDSYQEFFTNYFQGFLVYNKKNISYLLLFLILGSIVFKGLYQLIEINYINRKRVSLAQLVYDNLSKRGYNVKQKYNESYLSSLLITEIDIVIQHILTPILSSFGQLTLTIFLLGYLYFLDPLILGISFGIFGFYYFTVAFLIRKGLKGNSEERTISNTKRIRNSDDIIKSLALLDLYRAWKYVGELYIYNYKRYSDTTKINQISIKIPQTILEGILLSSIVLVVIVIDGTENFQQLIPKLTVFAFAALKLKPSLNGLYGLFVSISYGNSALLQLKKFILRDDSNNRNLDIKIQIQKNHQDLEIDIKNISFQYIDGKKVFDNFSFNFKPLGITTISGESGIGKSTLLYLISGLLRFQKGKIIIKSHTNNKPNMFTMVNQQGFLIEGNLLQNIYLKKEVSKEEEQKVQDLLSKLGLNELKKLIRKPVQSLSGGQNQRINILRAIAHNPECILMDEPSSALDEDNKQKLIQLLKEISKIKPIIIVTHDKTIIEISNQKLVFEANSLNVV